MRLNIWAPCDSTESSFIQPWDLAHDPSLLAVDMVGDNEAYFYEVEWAKVSVAPEPFSSVLFLVGSGVFGLKGLIMRRKLR